MEFTLIYPDQLLEIHPAVSRNRRILLIEYLLFFGDEKYIVKFYKKKLILHQLSIRSYAKQLTKVGYDVKIVIYSGFKTNNHTRWILQEYNIDVLHVADVVDYELKRR